MNPFRVSNPSRLRVGLAVIVALAADTIQILLGPLGWAFADQIIDVFAMLLVSLLIGFHPLLIPTFIAEALPAVDMLPTWTGCVCAVALLKRRSFRPPAPPSGGPPTIDV
jgi:hypothetical protein